VLDIEHPVPLPERVLVTGAAGFIGSHLVDRLLTQGATVLGVDDFDPFYPPEAKRANLARALTSSRFQLIEVDCADRRALEAAIPVEPIDAVIHLAARAGVRRSLSDPAGYVRANVLGTQVVLDLARRRRIGRMILGSSSSVYGGTGPLPFAEDHPADRPLSPYAATKRAAELACAIYGRTHDVAIVALRFFTVYGPRQRPDLAMRKFGTLMLQEAPLPVFGDGSSMRDYTWIDDVTDGAIRALTRTRDARSGFEVFNLGSGRATPLDRLIELLAHALDAEPRIQYQPPQPCDPHATCADISKSRDVLGYAPRVGIEEGVRRFATWLRPRVPSGTLGETKQAFC
jgi:UDP-glucuronate 4-epimerase